MLEPIINTALLAIGRDASMGLEHHLSGVAILVLLVIVLVLAVLLILQRRTQRSLQQSQRILHTTLESTPDAVLVLDDKGRVTHYNAQFRAIWRIPEYPGRQPLGQSVIEYIISLMKTPRRFVERWENADPKVTKESFSLRLKDGRVIEWRAIPFAESGLAKGRVWLFQDVTRQKQTQKRLVQSESRLQEAQAMAQMGNWELDLETSHMHFSSEAARICGLHTEPLDFTFKQMQAIVYPEDRSRVEAAFFGLLHEDQGVDIEYRLQPGGDRPLVWVHSRAALERHNDNSMRGVVGTLHNVTERRQMENERNALQLQLMQSQKMEAIGTLAGGIAHDFNNILGAMIGYAEVAKIHLEGQGPGVKDLDKILAAGQRARDLVNQILTFSRQDAIKPRATAIKPIIEEALKLLRPSLPATIKIRTHIQTDGVVVADPTQIHQILMNLCTNAFHAMQHCGGVLTVGLEEVVDDRSEEATDGIPGCVRLKVSDTGEGIQKAVLRRIWEPFYTTKENGQGTGMGLSVVHGIVTQHGGRVEVASRVGRGTTFDVWLPKTDDGEACSIPMGGRPPTGSEHILLIDDEPLLIDAGRQLLEHLGYRVSPFLDSVQALEVFRSDPRQFDMVITDLTMPRLSGDVLAGQALKIRPDLPVIICSGYRQPVDFKNSDAMGVCAVVSKPMVLERIARVVRDALDAAQPKAASDPPKRVVNGR